jgi:hypothetical protein
MGIKLKEAGIDDYTSHNTERLDVAQVKALLLTLPEVQAELAVGPVQAPAGATARAKAGTTTRAKPAAKTAPRPGGGKPRGRPRKTPA